MLLIVKTLLKEKTISRNKNNFSDAIELNTEFWLWNCILNCQTPNTFSSCQSQLSKLTFAWNERKSRRNLSIFHNGTFHWKANVKDGISTNHA